MNRAVIILEATFYDDIGEELARGAIAELEANNIDYERIALPGALEIPVALSVLIDNGKIDIGLFEEDDDAPVTVDGKALPEGIIALGCVIRGETAHYDIVANESARGLMQLAMQYAIPLGNGILTVENRDQAWARAKVDGKNKGRDAAQACLRLMQLRNDNRTSLIEKYESL